MEKETDKVQDRVIIRSLNESRVSSKEVNFINEDLSAEVEGSVEGAKKIGKDKYSWTREGNNFFISRKPNQEILPKGLYDIRRSEQDGLFLEMRDVTLDEIFTLPDENVNLVLDEFTKFWTLKDKYAQYGVTFKRGILLYGKPGTGKTSLVNILTQEIIKNHDGLVINFTDIYSFVPMVHNLRGLEPNKPILALIEDLYEFLQNNSTNQLLNLLDGNMQVDNIVYLATTNFMDRLPESIKNRPSRFDRLVEIGFPNEQVRKAYIEKKLNDEDKTKYGDQINQWVADTEGMSFSHMKELIIAVVVLGNEYSDTIARLKEMNQNKYEY